MRDAVLVYFQGEKHAGLLAAAAGVLGLVAALGFWPARWGLRSMAVTLGVLGVIVLAIGVGLYVKTGPQVERLLAALAADPPRALADEATRMQVVQRNFRIIEIVEVVLIIATTLIAVLARHRPAPTGVALGLLVFASFLLAFDLVAERRGAVYLSALQEASTSTSTRSSATASPKAETSTATNVTQTSARK